jgi:polyhydroxybutyrate depolymerase
VRRAITAFFFSIALMSVCVVACGRGDVILGARGAIVDGPKDGGAASNDAGAGNGTAAMGGGADVGGQSGVVTGSSGRSAAGASGLIAAAGAAAVSGAGGSGSAAQPSNGCGMTPPAADASIQVNGATGSYILDLPSGYDRNRAYPLLISLRGANVTTQAFRTYLNLSSAVGSDAIVAIPDCLGAASTWDVTRDGPYIEALLTHLESSYCLDQHRIFVAGHATGGVFASALGCTLGNELRGIAPLSASPPTGTCQGELAVWMSLGNADTGVAMGRMNRDFWVKENHCNASMSTPVDPSPCIEYAGCDATFPVRYCEYNGDLNLPSFAAAGIWEFFKSL